MDRLKRIPRVALALSLAPGIATALAQPDLASYFGFEPQRIIVVGEGAGPATHGDFNADGLPDLAVANNRKSRVEIMLLRESPRTDEQQRRAMRVNELPPNPWYDRLKVGVAHRITAIETHDFDGDATLDLVYVGADPGALVVLRRTEPSTFEEWDRRRIPGLAAQPAGLAVADVTGDQTPEIVTLVDGRVMAFPISDDGRLQSPTPIGSDENVVAVFPEDYDGDGLTDLLGVAPDDPTPLRLWLRSPRTELGAELRFEMPGLREVEPLRFPGRPGASIAVIERSTRRMVFYDLVPGDVPTLREARAGERDAQAEILSFPEGTSKDRSVAVGDVDGDGLPDVIATDRESNALTLMLQHDARGIAAHVSHPTFKQPKVVGLGDWRGEPAVFVLSEEERVLGVSRYDPDTRTLSFPDPVSIATPGATPVMMRPVTIDGHPALAVVVEDRRDYILEVHLPRETGGVDIDTFELDDARREPRMILPADADRDGNTDLLLLTPGEPMVMLRSAGGDAELLGKDDMPQFGLVEAAGPRNTTVTDTDADGLDELLIADANFVRACAYDPDRGWLVLHQSNAPDPNVRFAGVATLETRGEPLIVAADAAQDRLYFLGRDAAGTWGVREVIRVLGFDVQRVIAGSFTGDGQPGVLCVADEGLGLIRLGGTRPTLDMVASLRPDAEDRIEHEIEAGDLNSDGYTDFVVLDAGEQMCSIYTFSATRRLYRAIEFEVFESRLFGRGQTREYEPSSAIVTDLTGDGRDDLALLVHDRVIVYPQATE